MICYTYIFKDNNNFCAVARRSSFVPALSKEVAFIIPCGSMNEARKKPKLLILNTNPKTFLKLFKLDFWF